MSKVKLRDAVSEKQEVTVEVRSALYADRCDACSKVFRMQAYGNEVGRAQLSGIFDKTATDDTGRGMGNIFTATACSFLCAHELYGREGWKRLEGYLPYVKVGAVLARVSLTLTSFMVEGEAALLHRWETTEKESP